MKKYLVFGLLMFASQAFALKAEWRNGACYIGGGDTLHPGATCQQSQNNCENKCGGKWKKVKKKLNSAKGKIKN